LKLIFEVSAIEPDALETGATLAGGHLKNRHATGTKQGRGAYLSDDRSHFTGTQFRDSAGIQPVFVAKRQIMKQIINCMDALACQNLRKARTNSFYVLHRGGGFQHLKGW